MSKRKSSKKFKQMMIGVSQKVLDKRGVMGSGIAVHEVRICEYSGLLCVMNHHEEPRWLLDGYVSEGTYRLGTISLTGEQMGANKNE
ncbi:hypothetical protein NVP1148O_29 [Vibrio phage 1.148.O._10N.286.54.A10]|nr:hypothetical protein NVP1148O_29 [Vibrio phage 1.148.O._10N.286.54.A10]